VILPLTVDEKVFYNKNMVRFFKKLIKNLEKFFSSFPHIPQKTLKIFLPIIPWYLFLKGLISIINGLRSLSGSFQFGSLPRIFSKLMDINPVFLFWNGILLLFIGFLYMSAFTGLAQKKTQYAGWQNWFQAAVLISIIRLSQIVFQQTQVLWLIFVTFLSWYLIFEFKKLYDSPKPKK
jgi:hypothetical protein